MSAYRTVLVEEPEAGITIVRLNRPAVLNAFDSELIRDLEAALDEELSRPQGRVLILTGTGRGFCGGADLRHLDRLLAERRIDEASELVVAGGRIIRALRAAPLPVIAAVNGVAAGGGANLALACDLRVASTSARLGQVFNRLGLIPDWGGTYLLPRLVGEAKALELFWTAELIGAGELLHLGLVSRVVPEDQLMTATLELARGLLARSPQSLALTKSACYTSLDKDLWATLGWEEAHQRKLFNDPEVRALVRERLTALSQKPAEAKPTER